MLLTINKLAELTGHRAAVYDLAYDPENKHLYTAGGEGWLVEWPMESPHTGKLLAQLGQSLYALTITPDKQLVAGDRAGTLHWLESKSLEHHTLAVQDNGVAIYSLASTPKGLLVGDGNGSLSICTPTAIIHSQSFSTQNIRCICPSPDAQELAIGSSDHAISILQADSLEAIQHIPHAHQQSVFSLAYAPDGSKLYSGGRDARLIRWERIGEQWLCEHVVPAHMHTINDIQHHPTLPLIATAGRDKTIKLWSTDQLQLLKVIDWEKHQGHRHSVNRLCWIDEHTLASVSDDRRVLLWRVEAVGG